MSTMGERIKISRESKNLLQSQLAKLIDVKSAGVISNWEKDVSKPDANKIVRLCKALDISLSYLLDYQGPDESLCFSTNEIEHIKKYRSLDRSGQETVNHILNHEIERMKVIQGLQKQSEISTTTKTDTYRYPYLQRIACAGTGFLFDDIPIDTIDAPYMYSADFIIGVNGDSMEPTYYDGELLYVRKTNELQYGDIGIFIYAGECFVKEYGRRGLISHNPDYPNITGNEDIRIIGEVIGKVEE